MSGWAALGKEVRKEFAGREGGEGNERRVSLMEKLRRTDELVDYTIWTMNRGIGSKFNELPTAYALLLKESIGTGVFPEAAWWERAAAIRFKGAVWKRATKRTLYARRRYVCSGMSELCFCGSSHVIGSCMCFRRLGRDGWRDEVWERDVAEAFLQLDVGDARV